MAYGPVLAPQKLTASDVGAVPATLTINGKALSGNIILTAEDIGALSKTGGTFTGSLKIDGSGGQITFGDGDSVHLAEPKEDVLEIKAKTIQFETSSQPSEKPLPVNQGGTGANSAAGALAALGAVPTTRKVNGKALSADISLAASDVGASASNHTHTAAQVGARPSTWTPTASDVKALPITGGTLTGNLTIKGSGNYGTKLNLGDGDLVHLAEPADDIMEIKAKSLQFETMSQASTKPLPVNQGGTGASTAAAARTALGAASSSHTHSQYASSSHTHSLSSLGAAASSHTHTASDVGALPITGGTLTGSLRLKDSTAFGMKLNLGDGEYVYLHEPTDDTLEIHARHAILFTGLDTASTNPLPINQGGTGANTAAAALTALGAAASGHTHSLSSLGAAASSHTHTASQVGVVPITRKVNGKVLSGDISLTASDVGAAASSHTHAASQITGAGNCEVYFTMYTGDGQDSRSWTFPHRPIAVFLHASIGPQCLSAVRGIEQCNSLGEVGEWYTGLSWSGNTFTWGRHARDTTEHGPNFHCNASGTNYVLVALLDVTQ